MKQITAELARQKTKQAAIDIAKNIPPVIFDKIEKACEELSYFIEVDNNELETEGRISYPYTIAALESLGYSILRCEKTTYIYWNPKQQ